METLKIYGVPDTKDLKMFVLKLKKLDYLHHKSELDFQTSERARLSTNNTASCLKEGDRVVLHGLQKMNLNGMMGKIAPSDGPAADRFPVKLDSSGKLLLIRPANLTRVAETSEPSVIAPTRVKNILATDKAPDELWKQLFG